MFLSMFCPEPSAACYQGLLHRARGSANVRFGDVEPVGESRAGYRKGAFGVGHDDGGGRRGRTTREKSHSSMKEGKFLQREQ